MTVDSPLAIASGSKAMTALIIAVLIERGLADQPLPGLHPGRGLINGNNGRKS